MAMNYDLSALELLQILGCEPAADYEADERLPKLLNDFLSRIYENPLFETADIWQDGMAYFSYESIAESIDEDAGYWAEHAEEWADSEYYSFAELPQSEWSTLVPNYLKIGSDYAAGIVEFAILEADLGADDYITKPFRPRELIARIRAALRKTDCQPACFDRNGIFVDPVSGLVKKNGKEIYLSALEYRLLLIFINNPGNILTRDRLLDELWDAAGQFVNNNTLTVYIKRLREKMEDDPASPQMILTVHGIGYRLGDGYVSE